MIRILPVPEESLPGLCREKGLSPGGAALRGYTAAQGEEPLGWCVAAAGEPCVILGVEAQDPQIADGLLRAALFPLYQGGAARYRFESTPGGPLPAGYVLRGEGELAELFAPCGERRRTTDE